ncbi:MAG: hypothetical protein ACRCXL_01505, partial [Dermatophilaceae bacterium]
HWGSWSVPDESQVVYEVRSWPAGLAVGAPSLLDVIAATAGVSTVVSLAARRPPTAHHDSDTVEIEAAVRVGAPPGPALDEGCAAVLAAATDLGATLRRCDGRQRAAAAATAPLGGFLR